MASRPTDSSALRRAVATAARFAVTAGVAAAMSLAPSVAAAHPFVVAAAPPAPTQPEGTVNEDPATSGATELDGQGKFGAASDDPDEMGDALEFDLSFGTLISSGNARQVAVTGASHFRVRRSRHQFSAAAAVNYGQASSSLDVPVEPTVSNVQGRARYDVFLARRWALFTMATGRRDPFQGLDFRLNIDPGVALYVLTGANERLWFEGGYDFQFDLRSPEATLARDDDGNLLYDSSGRTIQAVDSTRINHAARAFGGYFNKINEAVSFSTEVEFLQSVQVARRWRLNWNTALSTLLAKKLALAMTFTTRIDNDPLPRVRKVDTITAVNLVYRFF